MSETIGEALARMGTPFPWDRKRAKRKVNSRTNPPYVAGSETSLAAAISMIDHTATGREKVFQLLTLHGPMTDQQMSIALGMPINTLTPRRGELANEGSIVKVGEGKTLSGRRAVLWSVAPSTGEE